MGFPINRQPDLVEVFSLWPAGVDVAEFDLLEKTAYAARSACFSGFLSTHQPFIKKKYFLFGPLEWLWRSLTYLLIHLLRIGGYKIFGATEWIFALKNASQCISVPP
ncbi:MAG: DUF418 domain-containing protein [Bacteroidetes bacterium]|nr:MAG: DUF418 domain-containing protein [Bacteroidota bacterium]